MFSAAKNPLSMPMKTGHRLADGEPPVPIVTVSTAHAGATNIHALTTKASPVRADVLMTGMMAPPLSICALIAARRDALPVGRLVIIVPVYASSQELSTRTASRPRAVVRPLLRCSYRPCGPVGLYVRPS